MPIHEEHRQHQRRNLSDCNVAVTLGLSNTNIADADTVSGLRSKVEALSVHGEYAFAKTQISTGIRDAGTMSVLTDSNINGLTTAAGLRALFTANDATLSATFGAGLSKE